MSDAQAPEPDPTPDPDKTSEPSKRRRRRTPESARRAILDAAGRCLVQAGVDGLRLQTIAAELGISHSSILHHFGSRDGLLDALSADAFEALDRDLRASLAAPIVEGESRAAVLLDRIAVTLGDRGHARLLAWQILSGRIGRPSDNSQDDADKNAQNDVQGGDSNERGMLDRIAEAVHRARTEASELHGGEAPDLEDTRFFVLMMSYTVLGESLASGLLAPNVGLSADAESSARFRRWLAKQSRAIFLRPR